MQRTMSSAAKITHCVVTVPDEGFDDDPAEEDGVMSEGEVEVLRS